MNGKSGITGKYVLQDVGEPNLFRDIYPYHSVCSILFDNNLVLPEFPKEIFITDTTFRDGQQARPPYSVRQIVDLYTLMHRLGGPNGVVRQSEFFLYSRKDREAVERCLELGFDYPEVNGWIRARKEDFVLVKEMGLKETGILTSVSDYHIFLKLGKSRREAMEGYLSVVRAALEAGVRPRCHMEDVTRADIYGFVVPFAIELMKLREESGIPIKIRLCDTLGYGVPYPTAVLPRSVPKLVRALRDDAGVPSSLLEWHGHNDFHKVLVNATTAWLYGCASANGSLLGIGERTGNPPLEGLLIEYIELTGHSNGADTPVITEIRNYFEREIGYVLPSSYPFVGSEFNTTRAGVHADGLIKNEEIYNIFDTDRILNRPLAVSITDKSGLAGITRWINSHFAFTGEAAVDKRHPGVARINHWVLEQFEEGRVTAISPEEMEHLAHRFLPEHFVSDFDKLKRHAWESAASLCEDLISIPEMASLDPEFIEPLLQRTVDEDPFVQFAYVVNLDGRQITKIITQAIDKGKFNRFDMNTDFSGREWFTGPLATGEIYVSDLYSSKVTDALCITVSGLVRTAEGDIVGVMGLDLKFEELLKAEEL